MTINLYGLSSQQLFKLSKEATELAKALQAEEPSYKLALAAGISDDSYNTQRCGWVPSYSGKATITMENGDVWLAIGHKQQGNASCIFRDGYIEFIKQSNQNGESNNA